MDTFQPKTPNAGPNPRPQLYQARRLRSTATVCAPKHKQAGSTKQRSTARFRRRAGLRNGGGRRRVWTDPRPPPLPMLRQLVRSGKLADARCLFDATPHRDEVAYATLLAGYAAAADFPSAMEIFSRLRASSPPHAAADPFVLSPVFKACASAAADAEQAGILRHAAALHAFAVRSSAVSSVFVSTALADAYAKAGRLELALQKFDEMPCKNVVSWTTLVASLARAGRRHDALRRFAEMRASGVACDSHAYAAALTACADAGLLPRGREVHALCAKLSLDATPYVANTLATVSI